MRFFVPISQNEYITYNFLPFQHGECTRVFASIANGTLLVFQRTASDPQKKPLFADEVDDVTARERDDWELIAVSGGRMLRDKLYQFLAKE